MKAKTISKYILTLASKEEELISNLKLQKLLYYSQGFHLAVYDSPLFEENVVNWMYGPVVEEVYQEYKEFGKKAIELTEIVDDFNIEEKSKSLINDVYEVYGQYSASALLRMTHSEPPWQQTTDYEIISHDALKDYFMTRITNNA